MNIDEDSQNLVAVQAEVKSNISDQISTSSRKCTDRRRIKLSSKNINRMCLEMDIARGKKKSIAGISETQKVIGNFSIIIYDLHSEYLY